MYPAALKLPPSVPRSRMWPAFHTNACAVWSPARSLWPTTAPALFSQLATPYTPPSPPRSRMCPFDHRNGSSVGHLGEPVTAGPLRDRLARTFADPTLTIGYWIPEQGAYVDEDGTELDLPTPDSGHAVRLIEDAGQPLAALIHDPAILDQTQLVEDIAAAARLAITNARLQAEVRASVTEVDASRRRLPGSSSRSPGAAAGWPRWTAR
jgi:hypothetical protein